MSAGRAVGFSIGRISFSDIDRFAERYGITDRDAFDRFRSLIRAMDEAFLTSQPSQGKPRQVSVDDAGGIKALLQRMEKKGDAAAS